MVIQRSPMSNSRKTPDPNRPLASDSRKALPDTSAWLTRNEAADVLNVSANTLRNYEGRGLLHPLRVPRIDAMKHEQIVVVYDPRELAKLPRGIGRSLVAKNPGEIAARAFELFREGKSNEEVVIEVREEPDKIDDLRLKWLDASGANLVITPEAKIALEKIVGPFASVAEFVERCVAKLGTA